jgi:cobalt-zinc-cadmium efflux system membrane fusion protein
VTAGSHDAVTELSVTGVVSPDVSRNVPVVSFASGRVIDLRARLGDHVRKGQVLLRVQSADAASALADYNKAKADDVLARTQLDRAQELFDHGAIAKKDLEVAQNAAAKTNVDLQNTLERMRVLGVDPGSPSATGVIDVVAPTTGVVTEQNVTNAAGIKTLDNSPNLLTISDLSTVWIVCDVYENDLPAVHVGDRADVRLAAYPDQQLTGRINDIGPILDPNLHTAKVRIEVSNPGGLLRVGMFVTAIFHGKTTEVRAAVPSAAVLHLHDRDWVYVPAGDGGFRRQEVRGGEMLSDGQQELLSGLKPGDRLVSNALVFQNTAEQ